MRLFLSAFVCFLLSFVVTSNSSHKRGNTTPSPLTIQASQCPPCSGFGCINTGRNYTVNPAFQSCDGTTSCKATYAPTFMDNGAGRHALFAMDVTCINQSTGESCLTITGYSVIENVCCPVGQTDPHFVCNGSYGGDGKCDRVDYCGTSTGGCAIHDQNCGCDSGLNKPHTECLYNLCEDFNFCGEDECFEDITCDSPICGQCDLANNLDNYQACTNCGGYWSSGCCYCEECTPIVIDVQGNGFNLTSANNGVRLILRITV
jgi:hypothetical protein